MIVSLTDMEEAAQAGKTGVIAALNGLSGKMISFKRTTSNADEYVCQCTVEDVKKICNQEKPFPSDWIIRHGTDISEEFSKYALPLIYGEANRKMKQGLPVYLYRNTK